MIRQVKPSDAEAIHDIYARYVKGTTVTFETEIPSVEEMRKRIRKISAAGPYFVCEEAGCIAGYCCAHKWKRQQAYGGTLEVTIYLLPEFKGRGLGTQMMTLLIGECRKAHAHALIACIAGENTASIKFHEKLGFRQVSHFREVGNKFGRWLDVVDCELTL
jgi:phosphinothricin acetyltransferase